MQRHESGGGDGIINGFGLPPSHLIGETTNKFAHELTSRVPSSSDDFYASNFSPHPQTMSFHGTNHFMEGIPLPNVNASINTFPCEKYFSFENQERLPIPVPFENVISTSFDSMLHSYGGGPPCPPPELIGRVVGRSSVHLPTASTPHSGYSRGWSNVDQNQLGLSSDSRDSSQLSNELSLSLVTSRPSILNVHSSVHEQSSETMSSNGSRTSYSFLSRSRFVEAMQEILAEVACYALENIEDFGVNNALSSSSIEGDNAYMLQKQEMSLEAKKKHLLVLLQMVDEQYSQCIDEIHTVTSAFHAVTELSPNLHVCFALPAISFMYKSLRERISSHIVAIEARHKEGETREKNSSEARLVQKQWPLQQQLSKRDHHQMWRPQRGLPETSVSVLRTWMFQNFLHPYPKDSEKHLLALRSGLTRSQVSNWFINARVRLWKPLIEEMCAEVNRRKARKENEEMGGNHRNQMWSETRRFTRDGHG